MRGLPILEPDLNGTFSHVNFLRDSFSNCGGWGRVSTKFHFQSHQLILSSSLPLLISLLLCQSTFAGRLSSSGRGRGGGGGRH